MTRAVPAKTLREAAHELNNLCSTIIGFATLAEGMDPRSAEATAYLNEIKQATEGVAAIARQLRDLSEGLGTPTS